MGLIIIFLEGSTWHTGGVGEIPDPSLGSPTPLGQKLWSQEGGKEGKREGTANHSSSYAPW